MITIKMFNNAVNKIQKLMLDKDKKDLSKLDKTLDISLEELCCYQSKKSLALTDSCKKKS